MSLEGEFLCGWEEGYGRSVVGEARKKGEMGERYRALLPLVKTLLLL